MRLGQVEPITSTFKHAAVFREAVTLAPSNPGAYANLRRAIRAGIADGLGAVPEADGGFRAHVSLAYSNNDGDGLAVRDRLDSATTAPATARFDAVSLIRMHRDRRMYEWDTIAELALGPQ